MKHRIDSRQKLCFQPPCPSKTTIVLTMQCQSSCLPCGIAHFSSLGSNKSLEQTQWQICYSPEWLNHWGIEHNLTIVNIQIKLTFGSVVEDDSLLKVTEIPLLNYLSTIFKVPVLYLNIHFMLVITVMLVPSKLLSFI